MNMALDADTSLNHQSINPKAINQSRQQILLTWREVEEVVNVQTPSYRKWYFMTCEIFASDLIVIYTRSTCRAIRLPK